MHFKLKFTLICLVLAIWSSTDAYASDSLKFNKNIRIYPILEGGSLGYEFTLPKRKEKFTSIKTSVNFRKNDFFSVHNGSESFKERSLQVEYRQYLKKSAKPMNGIFHGVSIHASHFEGVVTNDMLDEMSSFFGFKPVWARSVSAGYVFGYQKMTRSGFNFDIGYSMRVQKSAGFDFQAYWLDLIPYRPYVNGINSRVFGGIGLAF